jgi:hypothetical protein
LFAKFDLHQNLTTCLAIAFLLPIIKPRPVAKNNQPQRYIVAEYLNNERLINDARTWQSKEKL